MKIIVSHGNTDFDGLAGMVAASRLHPDAIIALRGSEEPQVSRFLENPFYSFQTIQLAKIDPSTVSEVICVDFSRKERLGEFFSALPESGIRFVLYDHHCEDVDIEADVVHVEPVGAVTTLLVEMLTEAKFPISRLEATLFMLGIYEDTGMLTHVTTCVRDLNAAARLLEMGADLKLVNKFLRYEFSPRQIRLFNLLIANSEVYEINGQSVAIARSSTGSYIPDAAVVVQKIIEIEGFTTFFAVCRMGDKIHIIGRSRTDSFDVGAILNVFGGGGHASAGSASVTGKTEIEAVEVLLKEIRRYAQPEIRAEDLMSGNLITVSSSSTLSDTRSLFTAHNINVLPVIDSGRVLGIVTRQQVEKALSHRLRGEIKEFMRSDFSLVRPGTDIRDIEHLLMSGTDRAVLVGEPPDKAAGIITRMDLFRRLYLEKLPKKAAKQVHSHKRSHQISEMMENRLPEEILSVMRNVSEICQRRDEQAFLVGGIVRDLFLNIDNKDVDILIAGNAIEFAREYCEVFGGRLHTHDRFGTALAILDEDFRVDFTSARSETYTSPGALPDVRSSGLRADLFRRDFTINAMAVALHPGEYGQLLDYFGGRRDLQNKTVRVLHSLSFIDDPTRVLRALRFCARLGFSLSRGSSASLNVAIERNMLWRVSGKRIFNELHHIFSSGRAIKSIELFEEHGVLKALHRKFKFDRFTRTLVERIGKMINWFAITFPDEQVDISLPYLMALMEKLSGKERSRFAKKLMLPQKARRALVDYKRQVKRVVILGKREEVIPPSRITRILDACRIETVIYAHAFVLSDQTRNEIRAYLMQYRFVESGLSGDDIRKTGLEEGPEYSRILKRLRDARLDGETTTLESEKALLNRLVTAAKKKLARE